MPARSSRTIDSELREAVRTILTHVFFGALVALLGAPTAYACEPSPSGVRSFDTRVSPAAGGLCLYTLTLYEGARCDDAHRLAADDVDCATGRRLALLDDGTFVSIRAARAAHRDWAVLTVFTIGPGAHRASLTLDDLPESAPLHGAVRLSFDAGAVLLRDREREVRIALGTLAARR